MSNGILLIYLGPSLEDACKDPDCPVCGKVKENPCNPVCLRCFAGKSQDGVSARLDYPPFGLAFARSKGNKVEAWNDWVSDVFARRN